MRTKTELQLTRCNKNTCTHISYQQSLMRTTNWEFLAYEPPAGMTKYLQGHRTRPLYSWGHSNVNRKLFSDMTICFQQLGGDGRRVSSKQDQSISRSVGRSCRCYAAAPKYDPLTTFVRPAASLVDFAFLSAKAATCGRFNVIKTSQFITPDCSKSIIVKVASLERYTVMTIVA